MNKKTVRLLRKVAIATPVFAAGFYFIPIITGVFVVCGLLDVIRNTRRDTQLFANYFLGNGIFTWVLSPFNLAIDLISYRNRGVWQLEDFPAAWRAEIEGVLAIFQERRAQIIADIDAVFEHGRRGMYVYQWYGKQHLDTVPEFNARFRYIRTIAVSVFSGRESTSLHFGPLRLSLRVPYNLRPAQSERVFIEVGSVKHLWTDNPLFIFDDTLQHRSVNELDGRRYAVFMDVIRPSPVPAVISVLLAGVSAGVGRINRIFYKNWKMLGRAKPGAAAPAE